ncbi:MAG: prolyl oligopeptidase family serine peptidase [Chitinophagaceae bacterium]
MEINPAGTSFGTYTNYRYLIFKIKPFFKDTRDARIKKKKADDLPKDSLGIIELGKEDVWKIARVKTYKTPEKSYGWVAYHLDKKPDLSPKTTMVTKKTTDSLIYIIDSLKTVIESLPGKAPVRKGNSKRDADDDYITSITDADDTDTSSSASKTGTDLVLHNLKTGEETWFKNVVDYGFSKNGRRLFISQSRNPKDSLSKATVLYFDLRKGFADTLSRGVNDVKNFGMTEDGGRVAFVAERNAKPKDLQKFYKLWYYSEGMDSAILVAEKGMVGIPANSTVSEFGEVSFSKTGKRLFFGTAPIQPPKDTNLIDIDLVRVDIWHYNDDYIQPVQLNRLRRDQQQNYLAAWLIEQNKLVQLGSKEIPLVIRTNEGDGGQFVGITDFGKRIESQWTGSTKKDIYSIDPDNDTKKLVKKDLDGEIATSYISPTGKYIMWYDNKAKNYFIWDGKTEKNITDKIKVPLYDEDNDSPIDPSPYGVMGWMEDENNVLIYDKYGVWKTSVTGISVPYVVVNGRHEDDVYRYVKTDRDERFITPEQEMLFTKFNKQTKLEGLWVIPMGHVDYPISVDSVVNIGFQILKAKNSDEYIYTKETFQRSPDLYVSGKTKVIWNSEKVEGYTLTQSKLSNINPQQANYNWGTAELVKWKAYNGKESMGIVYKPEDFDPTKKYPMICYFYETLSDGLYTYQAPSPTPSRLNIPFFVSRGYIVFAPDIHYTTGHPGPDAYNYIVSGARALVKKGYVDSTRIGIQGQSWGGYQVAYLVTATNLFKAAWAGAPVANMTSAYGGIRWESGLNRQFQYERTQSRIGATLWEKPQLYIDNSPLFRLPKVKTPLVIMSNDADGAVPWYQGIELFTAMRRLGKKVWLLNYNGEAHNLVERRNRKDIQIREQQYFDWLLKDAKPPKWITTGVPAVDKGKDWGLEEAVSP